MAQHFDSLSRELSCPICLCVMSTPVARLPCCHYFCMGCIQQSVRHRGQCPVCKAKAGRRDIACDDTMDRVVTAFAKLESQKDELLAAFPGGKQLVDDADLAPAGAAKECMPAGAAAAAAASAKQSARPASIRHPPQQQQQQQRLAEPALTLFETAPESLLGRGESAGAASQGEATADGRSPGGSVGPPAAGGICWLTGVDNDDYRSPSISFAGSAHQQRRQVQAAEGRRLSLHSVQQVAGLAAGDLRLQQAGAEGEVEGQVLELPAAGGKGGDKGNAAGQGEELRQAGQQQLDELQQPGGKQPGRNPKAAAAWRQRQAEDGPAAAKSKQLRAAQKGQGQQGAREEAQSAERTRAGGKDGGEEQAGGNPPPVQRLPEGGSHPMAEVAAVGEPVTNAAASESAAAASPGDSVDLQGLANQVAATAAAVAAAAGPAGSGSLEACSSGAAPPACDAVQLTPAQPAQAAAPNTDRVAAQLATQPAAAPSKATGASRAGATGRKRASAGAADVAAVQAGETAGSGGPAGPTTKRGRTVASAAGSSSAAAAARRKSAPAAAAAAPATVDGGTPAAVVAADGAAARLASTGGAGGSRRRIPTRLLPWNCAHCTFENQGAAAKCEMCGLKKKVLEGAELAVLAGATPAGASVAAAAERLQDVTPPAEQAAAAAAAGPEAGAGRQDGGVAAALAGGRKQQQRQRQRKMSGGAGTSGGKRRKVDVSAAAAAAGATLAGAREPSPEAAAQEPGAEARAAGAAAAVPGAWASRSTSKGWLLLGSSLSPAGKQQLEQLAAAAGAGIAKDWSDGVTHVVCGSVDGVVRRTYKYLRGLLAAKWVVTEGWLQACLQQNGPAREETHLARRDHAGCEGGAAAARSSAELGLPPLLRGYEVYLAGEIIPGSKVGTLLSAAGAKRLSRRPAASHASARAGPCTTFLLCEAEAGGSPQQQQQKPAGGGAAAASGGATAVPAAVAPVVPPAVAAAKWYQQAKEAGVPVVSHRWLLDSISCYTVKPLAPYQL